MNKNKSFVLYNCNLIRVENNCEITPCSIYVEEGVIRQISDDVRAPLDVDYVDMQGKYIAPGLVNLHVHLFGSGQPSKLLGGGKMQQKVLQFIRTKVGQIVLDKLVASGARTQLMSGCTTIRTVGDFCYSDVRIRNKVAAGKAVGPRMLVSGPAITAVGGHGDGTFSVTSNDPEELRELVRENVAQGVDFIKICVTGGVIDAKKRGEPGEVKMNFDQTYAVVNEAHRLGKVVASHTESELGVQIAVAAGVDTIEHGADFTANDIANMLDKGSKVVATFSPAVPLANLSPEVTKLNDMATYNTQVLLDGMTVGGKKCLESGVTLGMGTDSSCPFVTQYAMPNEVLMFAKYLGVSNAYALTVATKINAEIIGLGDVTGTVEVGKSADFIVMQDNPLTDITALKRLSMVCCQGVRYDKPKYKHKRKVDKQLNKLLVEI